MKITPDMKKSAILALLIVCSAMASVAQTGGVTIKGTVDGIKKGRLYLLARSSEESVDTVGFCDFKNSRFELKAKVDEPLVTQLVVGGFSGGFTLFVEPGVTYKACLSEGDNFYIKGGKLNEEYTSHMKVIDSLRTGVAALQQRYDELRAARKFRSASLVNDTLQRQRESLAMATQGFLRANDNIIMAYTVYSNIMMREMSLRETQAMYNSMGEGAKATQYGRFIEERIKRLSKTEGGAKAPDFTLPDLNGVPVTMSSVKGKIKIIDFWASWCGPCRLNNPELKKIYEEYHSKGLEIIGVSLDEEHEDWALAVEKDGLGWVNVSSLKGWDCDVARLYNVKGVPALFLLDENNCIIATGLRDEKLRAFLQENLK